MNSRVRILVVDDEPDLRHTCCRLLSSIGYEVMEASTGEDGLRLTQERQPNLVLLDVSLPDIDGIEVCKRIKADATLAGVFVILSSTQSSSDWQVTGLEAGADGYIVRPISDCELVAQVQAMVRMAELIAANATLQAQIAERMQTEEALRESVELFRSFVEQSLDGIMLADEQGKIVEWNLASEKLTGLTRDEVLGKSCWDVQMRLAVQERQTEDMRRFLKESTLKALSTGHAPWLSRTMEVEYRRADGSQRIAQQTAFPIKTEAGFRLGAILRDVTESQRAEAQVRHGTAQMMALRRLGLELAANLDLDSLMNTMTRRAIELVGGKSGGLFLYRPEQDLLMRVVSMGANAMPIGTRVRRGEGLSGRVMETGESLFISDYAHGEQLPGYDRSLVGSVVSVPIRWGHELLGVLDVALEVGGAVSPTDIELLTLFASQAAISIKNARLFDEEQRRAGELTLINNAIQEMALTLDVEKVLSIVTEEARHALQAEWAATLLQDGDELVFATVSSSGPEGLIGVRLPVTSGIAGAVWRARQPVLAVKAQTDPRFDDRLDAILGQTTHSLIAVPLMSKGKIWGVIQACHLTDQCFSEHDVVTLQALSNSATVAIENAQLYQSERDQRDFAETLREVSSTVIATLDMDIVLDRLLEQVSRVVPNDAANVMLVEESLVRIVRHRGYERFGGVAYVTDFAFPITGLAGIAKMAQTRGPIVMSDAYDDAGWVHLSPTNWIRSYAGAPICVRGETVGFLNVNSATSGFFSQHHAERLQAFADQAGIAIENARLYQAQQDQYRRLHESQARLIQAEKMSALGRLTASIAHEINNPLQAVQSCLTLVKEELDEGGDPQEIHQDLEIATIEVARVATILKRLRDFYRPAREGIAPTDLHAVLSNVLELAHKQLQRSKVTVEREWAADLPFVSGNADHLKQVFLNLLLNAADAIGEQGGIIRLRTAADEMQGLDNRSVPAVRVEVSDTGAGISPEVLARLFEPFSTTKSEGTGLGLYISYEIVRAHNGQITATSQRGQGTTFTILLPAVQAKR